MNHCELCNFSTANKSYFVKHQTCKKHLMKLHEKKEQEKETTTDEEYTYVTATDTCSDIETDVDVESNSEKNDSDNENVDDDDDDDDDDNDGVDDDDDDNNECDSDADVEDQEDEVHQTKKTKTDKEIENGICKAIKGLMKNDTDHYVHSLVSITMKMVRKEAETEIMKKDFEIKMLEAKMDFNTKLAEKEFEYLRKNSVDYNASLLDKFPARNLTMALPLYTLTFEQIMEGFQSVLLTSEDLDKPERERKAMIINMIRAKYIEKKTALFAYETVIKMYMTKEEELRQFWCTDIVHLKYVVREAVDAKNYPITSEDVDRDPAEIIKYIWVPDPEGLKVRDRVIQPILDCLYALFSECISISQNTTKKMSSEDIKKAKHLAAIDEKIIEIVRSTDIAKIIIRKMAPHFFFSV